LPARLFSSEVFMSANVAAYNSNFPPSESTIFR
jgi:hypothetical protein